MPFHINPAVEEQEYLRHRTHEWRYIEGLRRRGLLIEIENVAVDAEQLVLRTFQCNSSYCVRCSGEGSGSTYKGSCCTDLSIDLTPYERERLVEMARLARERLTLPREDPLNEIVDQILGGAICEVNQEHEDVLAHRGDGRCVLSWMEGGTLRCSVNTLCERMGLAVERYKPDPCYLFPLHYSEYAKGQYLLSVLSKETRSWIGQDGCVGKLRCLRRPEPGAPPAYQHLRREIEHLMGREFYQALEPLARAALERYHAESAPVDGRSENAKAQ